MQITLPRVVWITAILVAAAPTPTVRAQGLGQPRFVVVPTVTNIRVQTTVTVPDGGTALVGGYSRLSEGRTEYGVPVLGKVPYVGRGFRNVGYGRTIVSGKVTATVRIIDLREEEFRQTGVRSGP
jgi:type II secretory pathway component GspD/PulD (secretin)